LTKGSFLISNNFVRSSYISQFINCIHTSVASDRFYDIQVVDNHFQAEFISSVGFYFRSVNNRKKVFSGNIVDVTATSYTGNLVAYDNTTKSFNCFSASDNSLQIPPTLVSSVSHYDPIQCKRTVQEKFTNNVVNSDTWRDWTGREFVHTAVAIPTGNYWSKGSRVYTNNVTAGGSVGWVCTVTGTPGTWKTFGAISA
jgi:hypothetical protein